MSAAMARGLPFWLRSTNSTAGDRGLVVVSLAEGVRGLVFSRPRSRVGDRVRVVRGAAVAGRGGGVVARAVRVTARAGGDLAHADTGRGVGKGAVASTPQ